MSYRIPIVCGRRRRLAFQIYQNRNHVHGMTFYHIYIGFTQDLDNRISDKRSREVKTLDGGDWGEYVASVSEKK